MLPQVANHIFHHTTRAVAAAQNQAGHTLRNVLGFQSGTTPSSTTGLASWNNNPGSSSWGHGHTGTGGGAKFNTGSRFYTVSCLPSAFLVSASNTDAPSRDRPVLWSRQIPHPRMLALPTRMTVMSHDRQLPKQPSSLPA